jgi:hypothetical protein
VVAVVAVATQVLKIAERGLVSPQVPATSPNTAV